MLKFVKILTVLFIAFPAIYFTACSSGEYDVKEYTVEYTEKTVKTDTIKSIVIKDDSIKQDMSNKNNIKDNTKDSYTYIVQIGAFSMPSNFDRFFETAKQVLGEDVYYEQTANLIKVRIGKYGNRAEAIKYVEFVRSKGYTDAFVITKKN
jgi:cell division protein FtsN